MDKETCDNCKHIRHHRDLLGALFDIRWPAAQRDVAPTVTCEQEQDPDYCTAWEADDEQD